MTRHAVLRLLSALALLAVCGGLYGDAEQEYAEKGLVIAAREGFVGSFSTDIDVTVPTKYTAWRFYQGSTKITEPQFLDIAGYTAEAALARKRRNTQIGLYAGSFSVMGASLGLIGYGLYSFHEANKYPAGSAEYDYHYSRGYPSLLVGAGLNLASFIPALIAFARGDRWMPLERAVGIRDSYNASLRLKLGLSTP